MPRKFIKYHSYLVHCHFNSENLKENNMIGVRSSHLSFQFWTVSEMLIMERTVMLLLCLWHTVCPCHACAQAYFWYLLDCKHHIHFHLKCQAFWLLKFLSQIVPLFLAYDLQLIISRQIKTYLNRFFGASCLDSG